MLTRRLLRAGLLLANGCSASSRSTGVAVSRQCFATDSENLPAGLRADFDKLVKANKVMVFMKGDPDQPQCGFSRGVCMILNRHGVQYGAVNVLENDEIRQGIKQYTSFPTIPQVFVNGEFVGGFDILAEMHKNGELDNLLQKAGVTEQPQAEKSEKKAD